jgi:hypothetical protein
MSNLNNISSTNNVSVGATARVPSGVTSTEGTLLSHTVRVGTPKPPQEAEIRLPSIPGYSVSLLQQGLALGSWDDGASVPLQFCVINLMRMAMKKHGETVGEANKRIRTFFAYNSRAKEEFEYTYKTLCLSIINAPGWDSPLTREDHRRRANLSAFKMILEFQAKYYSTLKTPVSKEEQLHGFVILCVHAMLSVDSKTAESQMNQYFKAYCKSDPLCSGADKKSLKSRTKRAYLELTQNKDTLSSDMLKVCKSLIAKTAGASLKLDINCDSYLKNILDLVEAGCFGSVT